MIASWIRWLLVLFFFPFSVSIFAQTPTEFTGQRELQLEQQLREFREWQKTNRPAVRIESEPYLLPIKGLPLNESPCFPINRIELVGDESKRFQWALDSLLTAQFLSIDARASLKKAKALNDGASTKQSLLLGQCYGVKGINSLMRQLQNNLVKRGWITTRVVAGPQQLDTGVLRLTVVPGRIHQIRFTQQSHPSKATLPLAEGELLNLRDIEQALETLKRLPSADTDIKILPSSDEQAKPGDSDLAIIWQQDRAWRSALSLDNAGSEDTGTYQANLSFAYDNLLGFSDIVTLAVGSDVGGADTGKGGTESINMGYSVPIKHWLLSFNANSYEYFQTIDNLIGTAIYSGDSKSASIDVSRLVYRNSTRRINAGIRAWKRRSRNFIEDTEILTQRRRTSGFELHSDYREFIGATTLNAGLTYRKGGGLGDNLPAPEELTGEGQADAAIVKANVQLAVPFFKGQQGFQYTALLRGQYNLDPLTAQDYFTIGNHYSVRGYDGENTLTAERGWFLRNDLEFIVSGRQQRLYLGLDYGALSGNTRQPELTSLSGGVVGVKGRYYNLSYDASVGWPINKPADSETDRGTPQLSLNWQF